MSSPERSPGGLRGLARAFAWPVRRILDPRFRGLASQIDSAHHDLALRNDELIRRADHSHDARRAEHTRTLQKINEIRHLMTIDMDASTESASIIGATISELSSSLDQLRQRLDQETLIDADLSRLDRTAADLLNYAASHRGFAAQKGLWLNPPVVLEHGGADVRVSAVNERVVEVPYVLRAVAGAPADARVLDVGANESTLAISLAGLGYRVTALDPAGYPFEHPFLEVAEAEIEDWEPDERFDVVICLSTLEHIGAGGEGNDRIALERIRELLAPEGFLVLTTPLGPRAEREENGGYDRETLEELLAGLAVQDFSVAVQESELVWRPAEGEVPRGIRAVALVTARRP